MRLRMAMFLIGGSVGLAGCTPGPDAYTASPVYAGGYGYGYDTGAYGYASGVPGSAYVAPPPVYEYGGPAYYGAPVYAGGGYARGPGSNGHDEDWRRRAWQNNAAELPAGAATAAGAAERGAVSPAGPAESGYLSAAGAGERGEVPAASPAESGDRPAERGPVSAAGATEHSDLSETAARGAAEEGARAAITGDTTGGGALEARSGRFFAGNSAIEIAGNSPTNRERVVSRPQGGSPCWRTGQRHAYAHSVCHLPCEAGTLHTAPTPRFPAAWLFLLAALVLLPLLAFIETALWLVWMCF